MADSDISSAAYEFSKHSFSYQNATVISECDLQDTPVAGGKVIRKMMIGDSITHLESFQDIPLHTRKDPNMKRGHILRQTLIMRRSEDIFPTRRYGFRRRTNVGRIGSQCGEHLQGLSRTLM